jgi:dienelactone hydrolase
MPNNQHIRQTERTRSLRLWMAGHRRSKNGAASLAYAPVVTAKIAAAALLAVIGWSLLAEPARAQSGPTAANYTLLTPRGAGPFPAVVVMHGCSGVDAKLRGWAQRLVGWGYAALLVDSFRPRGLGNICDRPTVLSSETRAGDAIAAKAYLQSLPNIAKGRIGLIGFSHGGGAALAAASSFDAVVAFYPWCNGPVPANALVLIGSADDWTPAARCSGDAANLKVYAGATHSFERPDSRINLGHREIHDAAAASDAFSRTRQFLASHLRG